MADKIKVAVIDDDKGLCLFVKTILEKTTLISVVTSTESKTAENFCCTEKPDVIVMDNVMPELKGAELIKILRKNAQTKKIPIIMLTGKGEMVYSEKKSKFEWAPNSPLVRSRGVLKEQENHASIESAYGVDAYLAKPVNGQVLLEVIVELLQKKQEHEDKVDDGLARD